MRYEGDIYRPPGEWRSYLLQCTVGCSYNGCTYCGMYKNKQYHVRPLADILEDIDMAREHFTDFGSFPLAQAVVLLATAPKSNSVVAAIDAAMADVRAGKTGDYPRHLQNVHADGAGFEREQGYLYPHDFPNHWVKQQYLPDAIRDRVYYQYGPNKNEQAAKAYWDKIKQN